MGKLDFNAFYSTTNPVDANSFASGYRARATSAFGPVASLGYVLAGTDTVYDPYAASGLVLQGQYRDIHSKFYSNQVNLSVAKKFETGFGSHDLKLGVYGSLYGEDSRTIYQNYLIEVAGKPRTLDLIAYNAAGTRIGSVTDKGVLNYAATLTRGNSDAKMIALFANDTWELLPGLRFDAGIRHERYSYTGYAALTGQADLGNGATLADNTTRAFTGNIINQTGKPHVTNWTAGANYDFNRHIGVYGRASHLETPPSVQTVMSINPTILTTIADQYEAGLKLAAGPVLSVRHRFLYQFRSAQRLVPRVRPVDRAQRRQHPLHRRSAGQGCRIRRIARADLMVLAQRRADDQRSQVQELPELDRRRSRPGGGQADRSAAQDLRQHPPELRLRSRRQRGVGLWPLYLYGEALRRPVQQYRAAGVRHDRCRRDGAPWHVAGAGGRRQSVQRAWPDRGQHADRSVEWSGQFRSDLRPSDLRTECPSRRG